MLLQKRAHSKYHSGGLWSNACCSHPRKGESMTDALNNRLKVELGLDIKLQIINPNDEILLIPKDDDIYNCGEFKYYASFGDLSKNELDHVFLYTPINPLSGEGLCSKYNLSYNPDEIAEIKWVSIDELQIWLKESPQDFTTWFKAHFTLLIECYLDKKEIWICFYTQT